MWIYVYVCICIFDTKIFTRICICICMRCEVPICIYLSQYIHTYIQTYTYAYMYRCIYHFTRDARYPRHCEQEPEVSSTSISRRSSGSMTSLPIRWVVACCGVLQWVAVGCSGLQWVAVGLLAQRPRCQQGVL